MKKMVVLLLWVAASAFAQQEAAGAPPAPPARQERRGGAMTRMNGTAGTISAIQGDIITLKTLDGREATVKVTGQTVFHLDQKEAKLADFKPGDMVVVGGESNGDGSWTARNVISRSEIAAQMRAGGGAFASGPGGGGRIQMLAEGLGKQFIVGEVKSVDGLKLTIERVDKQTQTIEVDENTSFRKQGESVTLADIKAGDKVMGRGGLNKDGVFVPTTLNVGDFPMMMQRTPADAPKH
jgi:uncharacterized protein DUF5666